MFCSDFYDDVSFVILGFFDDYTQPKWGNNQIFIDTSYEILFLWQSLCVIVSSLIRQTRAEVENRFWEPVEMIELPGLSG